MEIYHYHPDTGLYLGLGLADESPEEEGVFLIPAHATPITPPAEKADFLRVFVNGAWGFVPEISPEDPPTPDATPTEAMVTTERDRRIEIGFAFEGNMYQAREGDFQNILGQYNAARDAIDLGAQEGDYGWQKLLMPEDGADVFGWIALDNSIVLMDAQTVKRLGQAALIHKQRLTFAARQIKNMTPIPEDYAYDKYWP